MNSIDKHQRFLRFLRQELDIPAESIALVQRHPELPYSSFPMLLWRYGLISLSQLDCIFDWLDNGSIGSAKEV